MEILIFVSGFLLGSYLGKAPKRKVAPKIKPTMGILNPVKKGSKPTSGVSRNKIKIRSEADEVELEQQ